MRRSERRRQGVQLPVSVRGGSGKVMILGRERVVYAGLLGSPSDRSFGCFTVYVPLGGALQIRAQGTDFETAAMAVVPPYLPHRVASCGRMIGVLMIEPESVDVGRLPRILVQSAACVVDDPIAGRVRESFVRLRRGEMGCELSDTEIDLLFLGRPLESRPIDPRIAAVVAQINRYPQGQISAEQAARAAGLSYSRFLHLFRAEVGATFRGFRAWKRARSFLHYANGAPSLADLALEIGYPDSTHFSHSIRQVYGLRPSDIFAGSRDLAIVHHGNEPAAVR